MLSAVTSTHRETIDLTGMWAFQIDPHAVGETERWYEPGVGTWDTLFVPACWNEQRGAYDSYMGAAWYKRRVFVPASWAGKTIRLVIQGALLAATVWLNGRELGEHEGGFTPFEVDATDAVRCGEDNWLAVRVDNTVTLETIPMGTSFNRIHIDWFNWGGLYRPIYLEAIPATHLDDVTVRTLHASAEKAVVHVSGVVAAGGKPGVRLTLLDPQGRTVCTDWAKLEDNGSAFSQTWTVMQPSLWTPDTPDLYSLAVDVAQGGQVQDHVELRIGLRTVEVRNKKFYMNGQLFFQKGISRVEDAAMQGRASWGPVVRRDYDLLKQCGANIYRPAGYCPSIPDVTLADEMGVCVIIDIPNFGKRIPESLDNPKLVAKAQRWLTEAVAVYKNHPSVIMWDLGTEPRTTTQGGRRYIQTLYDTARQLDGTRPIFYIWHCLVFKDDKAQDIPDLLCLWIPPRMGEDWEDGVRQTDADIEWMREHYPDKPMILYFGERAMPGMHSDPPTYGSEDFQAAYFEWAWQYAQAQPDVIGFWWWCLCDYRCHPPSAVNGALRMGVYDRLRQPKLAASLIKKAYAQKPSLTSE